MDTFSVDENTRAALVRRNTFLLMGSQAALLGAGAVWFSLAVVAASDLAGKERWAGIFLAMYNLFVAGSALLVGRMMDRHGRRPGLVLGHALMAIGGGAGGLAVWAESLWGLFLAATVFGAGYGAALLGRVAAADMVPAERRGRVVGVVVSAGALGAIGGAPLVAVIEHAGGAPELAWVTIPAFALAGVLVTMKLRPDPQQLAVEEESTSVRPARAPSARAARDPAAAGCHGRHRGRADRHGGDHGRHTGRARRRGLRADGDRGRDQPPHRRDVRARARDRRRARSLRPAPRAAQRLRPLGGRCARRLLQRRDRRSSRSG